MRKAVKNLFTNRKTTTFVVFLFLSLIFSILTKLSKEYTAVLTVNPKLINIPEDVVILNDSTVKDLELTIKTYGFKWLGYYLNKPNISLDVESLKNIEDTYIWERNEGYASLISQFSQDVLIESVTPESLVFNYDKNATTRIPVLFEGSVIFEDGYNSILGPQIEPDSISIIGPSSLMNDIKFARTINLSLNNLKDSYKAMIDINQIDSLQNEIKFSPERITVNIDVKRFTEGSLIVPLKFVNLPKDQTVSFFPKEVEIKYLVSLEEFKNVKSSDFVIQCDLNNFNSESSFLIPELISQPSLVKNVRLETKRVDFVISDN
ncbi:MAG: CdaR family protein [bacterium]